MRGGSRKGAGRPVGSTDARLPPADTAAALDALRLPGESDAAMAMRFKVARQAISRARRVGVTKRQLRAWHLAHGDAR